MAPRLILLLMVAAIFAVGLVNSLSRAQDEVRSGGSYALGKPLLLEMSSAAMTAALLPLLWYGVRRILAARNGWLRAALATGIALLFSGLHIGGMVALRKLAMALAGGSYTFGAGLPELTYEFRKDAVTCFLLGITLWMTARRQSRAADIASPAPSPTEPQLLWLRDGTVRIRIDPRDIVWVTSAGNYVEYSLADGKTHLIRSTLTAEAARLLPFRINRVHRARLVNLKRVSAIEWRASGDFELRLDNGQSVSGSRRYRSAVASIATAG